MNSLTIVILIILVLVNLFLLFLFIKENKKKTSDSLKDDGVWKLVMDQMNEISRSMDNRVSELRRTVDNKLDASSRSMTESVRNQFSESQKLIKDITNELTQVKEIGRQTMGFADQLQSLQDILKNPKQRGVLGEYYLETLLRNVLPPGQYKMQYPFSNGEIVDAVVFVKEKIIPIDSKFSLENYNRIVEEKNPIEKDKLEKLFINDLKNRIQETSKYIRPSEGTTDFAFMFIPHEAIYYDLLINKIGAIEEDTENLIQRAASKYKVVIVSPTSFLAYLQTVIQGLKAMQIEETAKDIIKRVEDLGRHMKTYEEYYTKLGNSLSTTINHYNSAGKEFKKIDKDIMRITGTATEIEVPILEKPEE